MTDSAIGGLKTSYNTTANNNYNTPTNPLITLTVTSGVLINNGSGYASGTTGAMTVDTVDATTQFSEGDLVYNDSSVLIGTVTAVATSSITIGAGTNVSLANNAILYKSAYSATATNRVFSIVYKDDSVTKSSSNDLITISEPISSAGIMTEYSNLSATNGYSIRCYDSFSQTGLNLASINLDNNDFFVLVHSDDISMYHFARITKVTTADVAGDKFEFEPRLGNEIAQDVKFMVFKGTPRSDKIVAVSMGTKYGRTGTKYVCSEPLFYFFQDELDKEGELNHNTKYFIRSNSATSGASVVLNDTSQNDAFLTISDYRNKVVDYSKFTYHIDLVDKLRLLDDPDTATSNENVVMSGTFTDYTDYNDCFINARRDLNDNTSSLTMTGNTRYVNYRHSPENNNYVPIVYELDVEDSYDAKTGFANLKLVDSTRNLSNKVFNNDRLMIKQKLTEEDLNEWVEVGEIDSLSDASNREYQLKTVKPKPTLYFSANNEIKIGERICIVDTIPSITLIRLKTNSRLETEGSFTTATSVTSFSNGTKIYRRRLNPVDNTFLTSMEISGDKIGNLNVIFQTTEYKDFFADIGSFISNVDEEYGLLTITFENNQFNSDSALFYAIGSVFLYNEIFFGQIEQIDKTFDNGQSIFEVQGRNTLSKLVDITVNKDTSFSEDIIYSSDSPYNNLTYLSRLGDANFASATLSVAGSTITLTKGDKIYAKYANNNMVFVGTINATATGNSFTLEETSFAEFTNMNLYKAASKHYVFNKALSASTLVSSATSLSGASDKGVFFQSGNKIDITKTAFEGETLVGASSEDSNGVKYNPNSVGFYDLESKSMKSDSIFQTRLSDGATDYEDFDTVNTLLDFTILSVKEEGGSKRVELAPYLPLTLGRVQYNYANTQDTTFSTLAGTVSSNITSPTNYIITDIVTFDTLQLYSTNSIPRRFHGRPLYIDSGSGKEFLGLITHVQINNTSSYNQLQIYFDGEATSSIGDEVYVLSYSAYEESTKLSHELMLLNAGHLHGGKIITKLSPLKSSTAGGRIHTFDYPLKYGQVSSYPLTYGEKFGSSFYRIFNLEKGNINARKQTATTHDDFVHYYDKPSEIKYYAGAYRFSRGYYYSSGLVNNLMGTNKRDNNQNHILHESRGFDSVQGSRFWDTTVHAANENTDYFPLKGSSQYNSKDYLHQIDSKVARMFLFANADLHPYYSGRKDSLMAKDGSGNYKDISNYGLFSLKIPSVTENQDPKHMLSGSTSTITLKDSDYASSTIISADKTVGQLKRFGLMRLTELVFDWHFNQFDPENPPDKDKTMPIIDGATTIEPVTITVASASRTTTNTLVITPHTASLAVDDDLFDSKGRFIGKIHSVTHSSGVNSTIVFDAEPFKTDGTSFATGGWLRVPTGYWTSEQVMGHGSSDSMIEQTSNNFLSTFVTQDSFETTKSGTRFFTRTGKALGHTSGDADYDGHMILPFTIRPDGFYSRSAGARISIHDSKILEHFSRLKRAPDGVATPTATPVTHQIFMQDFLPIFLDRHFIEDGSELVDEGMSADAIQSMHTYSDTTAGGTLIGIRVGVHMASPFADKLDVGGSSGATYDKTADGVFAGFKPVLKIDTSLGHVTEHSSDKTIGNKDVYHYQITSKDNYKWLDFVDLTGCYLVSTTGKYYNEQGIVTTLNHGESLDEVTPTKIVYVLSHEVDDTEDLTTQSVDTSDGYAENESTTNSRDHIITVSAQLPDDTYYRIMQPNHTCFHNFSPKLIRMNTLSSKYTKKAYKEEMYDSVRAYQYRKNRGKRTDTGNNEAVLSMYVAIDGDGTASDDHLITQSDGKLLELIGDSKIDACFSDGDNVLRTSLEYREPLITASASDNVGRFLELGDMKKLLGVVSVSETFSILVNGDIDTNAKRAMIGSTATVCTEVEDTVEQVFIENDIKHSITKEDYEIFASPDFQGTNLFNLTNYLLSLKDKKMIGEGDTVKVVNADASSFVSKYSFSDDDFLSIESKKSNFGYFNEITVYGKTHKAVRKDFKEIKEKGKKSLEVFEEKLSTQAEVNREALKLLKVYTNLNEILSVEVAKSSIKMLSVGDTVEVSSDFSNIQRNQFIVLEMKHSLNGRVSLKLGKYIKGLEDTLANLLIESKATKSYLRKKEFNVNENVFDFFDNIKIKELHLLIRKRDFSGGSLGFSTTLNTNTNTLGFGGTVTFTRLLEEDL